MEVETKEKGSWLSSRIKEEQITKYLDGDRDFISDAEIERQLRESAERPADPARIREILDKSLEVKNLTPEETAALMQVSDPGLLDEMQKTALAVKKKVYDNRIVTFAPLYIGNYCVNECSYCGFRNANDGARRKILSQDEIRREIEMLAGHIGHKRLIMVVGEHPKTDIDYIVESIATIYDVKVPTRNGVGNIRRVNVNAPPMSVEDLRRLSAAGIGTYQVFQETYHRKTYASIHPPHTLKGHFRWRLYAMHRALEAGIDDVGIGVLFGLYDWKFEVMGLVYHALELESKLGIGPHTVSFPRLEPAFNTPFAERSPYAVSDEDFLKIITVIRLAIPYAGMIVTAREDAPIRRKALLRGITQMDASTKIGVGAYGDDAPAQEGDKQQFMLGDTRSLDEVIKELAGLGYITSFCTAGYRCGRTGQCIMDLLRSGQEGKFCKLNAVLTFKEWLDDFESKESREAGEKVLEKEVDEIRDRMPKAFPQFKKFYERIKQGERDLYF
ncbi:MAG: [FeFe] hydrogenase H-cluster radical SAM maturase HydG [Candidatus Omnitrophota bacterium]|jgi:2-iminoacetate synthase